MPLRIVTVPRRRTLATVVRSHFDVRNDPELQARAEAAFVRANPHLAGGGQIKAGTTLIVPDVPGLGAGEGVGRLPLRPAPVTALERDRLARLAKLGEQLVGVAREDGKAQRAELRARKFVAALTRAHPELGQRLEEITETAAKDAEGRARRAEQFHEAVTKAQADFERLDRRTHRRWSSSGAAATSPPGSGGAPEPPPAPRRRSQPRA